MSSYNSPQQYNIEPGPPQQPQYGPPMQPQPYVESAPPYPQPGGGQPPYQPPGGYTPMPPPPPRPRRRGPIVLSSILAVALVLGIGAFVFFQFVWTSGPDPAERFPATASMYVELNFDPSFDQTPKLLDHLSKFEGIDYDDTNDILADLLEESGLEGVDAEEDLASWLGRRHGMAMWQHDDQPYAVVNLASTDAEAAEAGLKKLRDASGAEDDQWAYTVADDSVLMVMGEEGASAALTAAETEAGDSPLSDADAYDEARSWLDGDQLIVYWADIDALYDLADTMGEDEEAIGAMREMFSGHLITGLSAFDDGFELSYRLFGEQDDPWTGSEDLLASMGDLPASDLAVTAAVPEDLAEITEDWADEFEELSGGGADDLATEGGSPLTDEEFAEYEELEQKWWDDELTPEEEVRYEELEERYYLYGTEDDPYEHDDYDTGSDFEDVFGSVGELVDLLSGAKLSFAGDFGEEFNPETLFFSAELADDRAAELQTLIEELADGEELPDGVEVDGSTLSFSGNDVASGTLSEDQRFSEFADAAPDTAALGVWVDLDGLADLYPEDASEVEPLSAFTWAHGSVDGDGTGLARLYLK